MKIKMGQTVHNNQIDIYKVFWHWFNLIELSEFVEGGRGCA